MVWRTIQQTSSSGSKFLLKTSSPKIQSQLAFLNVYFKLIRYMTITRAIIYRSSPGESVQNSIIFQKGDTGRRKSRYVDQTIHFKFNQFLLLICILLLKIVPLVPPGLISSECFLIL